VFGDQIRLLLAAASHWDLPLGRSRLAGLALDAEQLVFLDRMLLIFSQLVCRPLRYVLSRRFATMPSRPAWSIRNRSPFHRRALARLKPSLPGTAARQWN
jgi:hypothetical protein